MRRMLGNERGSVLLLAMLILLVMTAAGLMVVHDVTGEMRNVGAYRVIKQGLFVTEAGLTAPIAKAAQDQNVFSDFLMSSNFRVNMADINPNFFDFDTWGSFGPEFSRPGAANFVTWFTDPVDTHRVPGFSTGGFCYRRYTVTADGFLGSDQVDVEDPESVMHTARARYVSHLYLGPFPCGF